ncbi:MAG: hypothetical protein ACJ705_00590 [Nitrososphaeraceae archaeon]
MLAASFIDNIRKTFSLGTDFTKTIYLNLAGIEVAYLKEDDL